MSEPAKTTAQVMDAMPLMHPRTEDERRAFGAFLDQKAIQWFYAKGAANVPDNVIVVLKLEVMGGNCPRCGTPWGIVVTSNDFAEVTWFDPACVCYLRCPSCERSLHEEEEGGTLSGDRCPHCSYRLFVWVADGEGKPQKRVPRVSEYHWKRERDRLGDRDTCMRAIKAKSRRF